MRSGFGTLRERARLLGLYLTRYSPGDGTKYRVDDRDVDYFAMRHGPFLDLGEVAAFLAGWEAGNGGRG